MKYKFVFDTNSLISAALIKNSVNARALNLALNIGRIAMSEPVLREFEEVIFRKKFDKYFKSDKERLEAINRIENNSLIYLPEKTISICRDPKDDKFLELAVMADAACIISGDQDLLILNPYENIPMISAAGFLQVF